MAPRSRCRAGGVPCEPVILDDPTARQTGAFCRGGCAAGDPGRRFETATFGAKSGSADTAKTWQGLVGLQADHPNTPEAIQASHWLLRIPSPLDRLNPRNIPAVERVPGQPNELVAILGENRWRQWLAPVYAIAYRPDGSVIATGGEGPRVYIWDATKGRLLATLTGHTGVIQAVAYSPNGKFLASGSRDKTIRIWDAVTNNLIRELKGHKEPVVALAFSPDSQTLVSGSVDKTAQLWNLTDGKARPFRPGHKGPVRAVALCPTATTSLPAANTVPFTSGA